MSRHLRDGETIIGCDWCDAVLEVDKANSVNDAMDEAGWSSGWACARGRGGQGCQKIDLCPSCTPGGAT